jgi:IS1 family transposase
VNPKTVIRRFRYLAEQDRLHHESWLLSLKKTPLTEIQFDDLETFEHTKCKPLSVSLVVEPNSRKIIGFQVSRMPAKGHLSKIAFRKYGKRKDQRMRGWNRLLKKLKPVVNENAEWKSDDHPFYPALLRKHFPKARHTHVKGGRGAITGQGELKKLVHDPIFSLNHTCAMLRANLNRLFRKTWCTTKTVQGLVDHLSLYVRFHNTRLTPNLPRQQA